MVEPTGHCPHLGLKQNRAIRFASPTPEHRCYVTGDAQEIPVDQASYCLTQGHVKCPLYNGFPPPSTVLARTALAPAVVPQGGLRGWFLDLAPRDRAVYGLLTVALLVILGAYIILWILFAGGNAPPTINPAINLPSAPPLLITAAPSATPSPTATLTPGATATATATATLTPTATAEPTPTPEPTFTPTPALPGVIYVPVTVVPTEAPTSFLATDTPEPPVEPTPEPTATASPAPEQSPTVGPTAAAPTDSTTLPTGTIVSPTDVPSPAPTIAPPPTAPPPPPPTAAPPEPTVAPPPEPTVPFTSSPPSIPTLGGF